MHIPFLCKRVGGGLDFPNEFDGCVSPKNFALYASELVEDKIAKLALWEHLSSMLMNYFQLHGQLQMFVIAVYRI